VTFRLVVLALLVLNVSAMVWGDAPPSLPHENPGKSLSQWPTDHISRWVAEARAQREFLEAKRQAARAATDARLRIVDPWVASRIEETALRRELARNRSEQRRRFIEGKHNERINALEEIFQSADTPAQFYYAPCLYPQWVGPWVR
jgi:hypothetical protein